MLKKILIIICQQCLDGIGDMCHNPGCALCRHAVDLPISPELYSVVDVFNDEDEIMNNNKFKIPDWAK